MIAYRVVSLRARPATTVEKSGVTPSVAGFSTNLMAMDAVSI